MGAGIPNPLAIPISAIPIVPAVPQDVPVANEVIEHIETYTVPQYGDYPNDQVEEWTPELCIAQISKYSARFGKNSREGQELLDLIKIAHYAQIAYSKMKK